MSASCYDYYKRNTISAFLFVGSSHWQVLLYNPPKVALIVRLSFLFLTRKQNVAYSRSTLVAWHYQKMSIWKSMWWPKMTSLELTSRWEGDISIVNVLWANSNSWQSTLIAMAAPRQKRDPEDDIWRDHRSNLNQGWRKLCLDDYFFKLNDHFNSPTCC